MLSAILITFREGLEAALIVGIVIGYLVKIGQPSHVRNAWLGVGAAALMSALIAWAITAVGAELEGPTEQIFEGTTMFLAVIVLTWMIFWMARTARYLKAELHARLDGAINAGAGAVFVVAILAVGREGPTVQMGGAAAWMVAEWFGVRASGSERRALISAGAGAGLAAAFNAPLAAALDAGDVACVQLRLKDVSDDAILRACEDAGIDPRSVDGFASYSNDRNDPSRLAAALGLPELRFSNMQWGGGGGGGSAAVEARKRSTSIVTG